MAKRAPSAGSSTRRFEGRTDLAKASVRRRADAGALMASGPAHHRGAMYLAGYAVECKLKAIAMDVKGVNTLSELARALGQSEHDVYIHGLVKMIRWLPSPQSFRESAAWGPFQHELARWRPEWRYDPSPAGDDEAHRFLRAVDEVLRWLSSNVYRR